MTIADIIDHLTQFDPKMRVEIVPLKPGDYVILSTDRAVTHEVGQRLKEHMKQLFPYNECVVISDGMKLKIARPEISEGDHCPL